jgi:hypothetical protein
LSPAELEIRKERHRQNERAVWRDPALKAHRQARDRINGRGKSGKTKPLEMIWACYGRHRKLDAAERKTS